MMRSRNTSGSVLICVLVCLVIVVSLVGSMVKSALRVRQQMRDECQLTQTQLLLEAGIQRAVVQLQENSAFNGEDWRLDERAIPGFDSALVQIQVSRDEDTSTANVLVRAQLPADASHSIQRSYQFPFTIEGPSLEE